MAWRKLTNVIVTHIKWNLKECPNMPQNLKNVILYIRNAHENYKKSRGEEIRVGESSGNHLIRNG